MKVISATESVDKGVSVSDVFERVVCGIDGSPQSLEALRQVERLRPAGGELHLVTVAELGLAVHGGFAAPDLYDRVLTDAQSALARAGEASAASTSRLIEGRPAPVLRREIERCDGTAVAVGSHGHSRAAGILLGGTATVLLHEAPCSVLVARQPASLNGFPSSITVGIDGSTPSLRALTVARELADRLEAPLSVLVATGGKAVGFDGLRGIEDLDWNEQPPVDALVGASRATDLVVLGSRGLHGVSALGSVSERVAHRAASSVLVVRTP